MVKVFIGKKIQPDCPDKNAHFLHKFWMWKNYSYNINHLPCLPGIQICSIIALQL